MPDAQRPERNVNSKTTRLISLMIRTGNSLAALGCIGLLLAFSGLIQAESFAIGISSGIRVVGSIAIAGCLVSAIGYGVEEHFQK